MQTNYSERHEIGYEGQDATMRPEDTISRQCATEDGIPFGRAVSQGTGDREVVLGGTLTDFVGITKRDITLDSRDQDAYQEGAEMGVKVSGDIYVKPSTNVAAGDAVYFNTTTGRLSNNSGEAGPIPGARWMTSANAGELAIVHLK